MASFDKLALGDILVRRNGSPHFGDPYNLCKVRIIEKKSHRNSSRVIVKCIIHPDCHPYDGYIRLSELEFFDIDPLMTLFSLV